MNPAAATAPSLLLSADRLITGRHRTVHHDGAVLIRGHAVIWAGPVRELPADLRGGERIHLGGATLLPGLIDAHTHLALDAGEAPFEALAAQSRPQILAGMRERAAVMLAAGITTIRDLGAPHRLDAVLARETAAGRTPGPTVLGAGVPLTRPGGHCSAMGGSCGSRAQAEELLRANHEAGCRWTKVIVTGGFTTPGGSPYRSQWPTALLRAVIDLSHGLRMPVAVHAHGTHGIREAIDVGADSIEHCTWMTESGFDMDPDLVAAMARAGICASVTVNSRARAASGRLPWKERLTQLTALHSAGVPLAVGTDAGIALTPFGDLPASLPAYLELGLDPLGVLQLATASTARAINAEDTGALEAGLRADVLAVDGDPTTDLTALMRPRLVMAAGTIHHSTDRL